MSSPAPEPLAPLADPTAETLRRLLLQLVGSLTLSDHMGDAGNAVTTALGRLHELGLWPGGDWDDWGQLQALLARRGVTTLHGTDLSSEEDE